MKISRGFVAVFFLSCFVSVAPGLSQIVKDRLSCSNISGCSLSQMGHAVNDKAGSELKALKAATAEFPQPRLGSKERTRTWGTVPDNFDSFLGFD
jgi:hypothetical protein